MSNNEVIRLDDAPETWELDGNGNAYCSALEIKYIVRNPTSKKDAMAAVLAAAPRIAPYSNDNLGLDNVTFDGFAAIADKALGKFGLIQATAHYSSRASSYVHEVPYNSFAYSVGMQNVHISTSRRTLNAMGAGGRAAIDFDKAINVDSVTKQVRGVDIQQPVVTFSETHHFSPAKFTSDYKKKIAELVGTVNNGTFRQYAQGEVLFTGVSGDRNGGGRYWDLTFNFAVSRNQQNFTMGGISLGLKRGWEYPWAYIKSRIVNGVVKRYVRCAYIEEIYEQTDFKRIGIGVSDPTLKGL